MSGTAVDHEALVLREAGASYSAIARQLELPRASDAHGAFLRAMRGLPGEQRERVTANEHGRLDQAEARIRERDARQPEKVERRLRGIGNLRAALD